MRLVLRAVEATWPHRWRWLLVDESSERLLADHQVELDPGSAEVKAFAELYRYLRWNAEPDRRVASEAKLLDRMGAWIGSVALGEQIGQAIVKVAPVTVRVEVPTEADFLAFRPWELAHVDGLPLAARGNVALVYDLPGPAGAAKAPVGAVLRMLAVFSLPTATSALALRRERYELSRLVRQIAARGSRRVKLRIAQYGVTRELLGDLAEDGDGWDVLHLSGHGGAGQFLLERPDGSPDPVSTTELVGLLRPMRARVKLAVVSACQSAAATTAEALRRLGLDDPAAPLKAEAAQEAPATSVVARALVAELGCAVVAMRYPVVDDFAVGFTDALYNRIFRQGQTLDRAVAAAVPAVLGPAPSSARPAISVGTPALFGASAVGLVLTPPKGRPDLDPKDRVMAGFPPEPVRFVGRAEPMAAASAALAPESGRTAVVFHGMAGGGKTACALELAYRHQAAKPFEALAFWSAPPDPDQFVDPLHQLARAWENQLGHGFEMVGKIATRADLNRFLPQLRATLQEKGLLLVLDNLETLLTIEGHWRDPRWAPLMDALIGHDGESRVILTSQITPAGLDPNRVLIRPVHALSRDESVLLARELPNLRALLYNEPEPLRGSGAADPALGRRVLTLVQGHPKLLELADAAAADPARLAAHLAAAEAAVDGAALSAFLRDGATTLDDAQFLHTLTAWTTEAVATLPAPSRLLLQALCQIEETDRYSIILEETWADLWRRLDQPGDPPPLVGVVDPLVAAALISAEDADPTEPDTWVVYRIHPGIAKAVHTATSEQVTTEVDTVLAAVWNNIVFWGIEKEKAGQATGSHVVRAGLAAVPYLLRLYKWDIASNLIEQALMRDSDSPVTLQAALPSLRRIAEATGKPKNFGVLGAALSRVNPDEAETLLRRSYDQAATSGDHRLASYVASHLVDLLCAQGKLPEALTLNHQIIEHTHQTGGGSWTQLGHQAQRLQILSQRGDHEQVLTDLPTLSIRMDELPDQPADNDTVTPWDVRKLIFDTGRQSALALKRYQQALDLNKEVINIHRRRGATAHAIAGALFYSYGPLIELGRRGEAEQVLDHCHEVFETCNNTTMLGQVFFERADLEYKRGHLSAALDLDRKALRLKYVEQLDPSSIALSHHEVANRLIHATEKSAEQRAHHLAAALLYHFTSDTYHLNETLRTLAIGLRHGGPDAPTLPTTLPEVIRLVDAGHGVHFGDLVAEMCPDPDTADRALAELLATAATLPGQPAENTVERLLAEWDPIIAAVATAATTGHTPTELADALDGQGGTADWAAPVVAALRRVLAGERDRVHLLAGLDDVDIAILTATLDRLPTDPGQTPMTSPSIDALTDLHAVRVLALVVDHHAPLPGPTRLRELDTALAHAADDPDLRSYLRLGTPPPSDGDLARATLTHLATTRPELATVIDRAVRLAEDSTRFELATLALGGLVLLALQTEIKIERNTTGEWRFRLHKKAMRDSTLGRLLGQLLAFYTKPPQQ